MCVCMYRWFRLLKISESRAHREHWESEVKVFWRLSEYAYKMRSLCCCMCPVQTDTDTLGYTDTCSSAHSSMLAIYGRALVKNERKSQVPNSSNGNNNNTTTSMLYKKALIFIEFSYHDYLFWQPTTRIVSISSRRCSYDKTIKRFVCSARLCWNVIQLIGYNFYWLNKKKIF